MRGAVVLALLAAACASGGAPISGDSRIVSGVTVTFRVEPSRAKVGQAVRLSLNLQNDTGTERRLTFPTAQRYDFVVSRGGREVWRWSADRAFAQVITTETIPGQGAVRWEETWRPEAPGRYRAQAVLRARGYGGPLEAEIEVA